MKVGISTLQSLLGENVCEIKFQRRKPKAGQGRNRRMLCTNSPKILSSNEGQRVLGYTAPKGGTSFNPLAKNLIVVWDILQRGFRAISMDSCELISTLNEKEFWPYYNEKITKMTSNEVKNFSNV